MAFRDDLEASQARTAALERQVAELEAENAELRADPADEPPPLALEFGLGRGRRGLLLGIAVVFAPAVVAVGAVSAGLPEVALICALVAGLAVVLVATAIVISRLLLVIPPGAAAVVTGRKRTGPGGRSFGYRIVHAGRTMLIPIVETADLLDLRPRSIDVKVAGAYCKTNIPVSATLRAVIRVAATEPVIDNAIERFLGRSTSEIDRCARETLEGHVRGLVARLELAEIRRDPVKVAHMVIEEAEEDLRKLGLELDTLDLIRADGADAVD
jgi:uncharacterized membrane protein YqiK